MMPLDMTTRLAPVFWGMIGFLVISAIGITFSVLRNNTGRKSRTEDPETERENSNHNVPQLA